MPVQDYYDRFTQAKGYDRLLFRPDRILQSAELNELQSGLLDRIKTLASQIFKDGDIVRGATCAIDTKTGAVQCTDGELYIAGAVRPAVATSLKVPLQGVVEVGVWVLRQIVTPAQDEQLLNPAVGMHGYAEPGADRERVSIAWGLRTDTRGGEFVMVYIIDDGQLRPRELPPHLDAISRAISRYDSDSAGGHYIVRGMQVVQSPDLPSGEQVYTVAEGSARIAGRALDMPTSRRLVYQAAPDLLAIDSEPHTSATEAEQTIKFDRWPVVGQPVVRITVRTTKDVTHGGFTDTADPLPDTAVIKLESIRQGTTVFKDGVDCQLKAGRVDWSLAGAEPAPGSTYTVTYQNIITATITGLTSSVFTVKGALHGTLVLVTYTTALRRWDRLVMNSEGQFAWVKGVASEWTPQPPRTPQGTLSLASVYQSWDSQRRVLQDGVRMVPMETLSQYADRLDSLREDQAEMRLALDVAGRYSGVKKGLFADPFISDSMRDAGQDQTAAIVRGQLLLPLAITVQHVGASVTTRQTLPMNYRVVINQPAITGSMLVNPYQAFEKMPVDLTLTPAVDRWTEVETKWAQPLSEKLYLGSGGQTRLDRTTDETKTLSEKSTALASLRQIDVQIDCAFGPGEGVKSLTFDGIAVTPTKLDGNTPVAADATTGRLLARFKVPANVPAGTKTVAVLGTGGSSASALFTGQGTLVQREQQQITKYWYQKFDPLAQTVTLGELTQVNGVDLWFTERNAAAGGNVLVQLRETDNGYPSPRVLAETRVLTATMAAKGKPTRVTWAPVLLDAGQEYALVILCDDAITAASVATLGQWDTTSARWVAGQPYQVGVLLSSSNASTWTPHQDKDLTFALLGADYTAPERLVDLGLVKVTDATDLLVLAHVHQPTATATGDFVLTLDGVATPYIAAAGQAVSLPTRYTGNVGVQARLRGNNRLGSVLEPGVQLVAGSLQTVGTYVSPMLGAGGTAKVRVIFEADLPDGSAVKVHAQAEGQTAWVEVPYLSQSPYQVGVLELTHELAGMTAERLRVRLTLTGTHLARPSLRNLRVVVL